ncbi:MAG TPA: medium chain dehydrogenase/reductase family protein [Streptosporangiaceae bacterium]|jgi:NADPH2:quinone reductase|nr:medium chain dehydrogenase/reductase family protein [Streptosporangiaceae bacterium]
MTMSSDEKQASVTATEVVLPGVVEPSGLQLRQRTLPPPAAGQVLVRVEAAGVSFAEQGMRRNRYPGQPKFPFVPGYDLIGVVTATGPDVDRGWTGKRVAALTKTGGWASHALIPAVTLVEVPDGVDPAEAETLVVNGITAWQLLHRSARVQGGQTVLVHGANGGVGSTLAQLARHAGARVIGMASPKHHDQLRALGVEPLDYHDPDLAARVRELAPDGVDAVFDHLGLASARRSYRLLARGGTLVAYGQAAQRDTQTPMLLLFVPLLTQLALWNYLPTGRRASFYNVWGGHRANPGRFWARLRSDLGQVLGLLRDGILTAQVAARMPLTEVTAAMELAESHTVVGKVILEP